MLARQEIREYVIRRLRQDSAVKGLVGAKIYDSKVTPFVGKELPGINVVTRTQNATSRSINIVSLQSTLDLRVEIYVTEMTGWAAKADAIAEAVEECLLSDPEFTKRISELETYDVEYSLSDQGARPAVVEILSFKLSYFQTYQPTITDDLNSVDIDVDVIDPIADPHPGPDGRIEFKVKANLQEDQNVR